jgi:hypothetical protein
VESIYCERKDVYIGLIRYLLLIHACTHTNTQWLELLMGEKAFVEDIVGIGILGF